MMYQTAVVGWGMPRCEFWAMHPSEFWWLAEAHKEKVDAQKGRAGKLTEDEAVEMADELRHYRVKKGYSPE